MSSLSSYSVNPNKKEKPTMKDILVATNYEEKKEVNEIRKKGFIKPKEENKKEEEFNRSIDCLPPKLKPATPMREKILHSPTPKQTENKLDIKQESLLLEAPLHGKKSSDVTTKYNVPNQMKSLLFYDETAKKINHRRTASEGMSKNFYQNRDDLQYIGNDEEKKKLQELVQSKKFYFYGEKRDALVETAKMKSEKKEKYVDSLIEGYNFSSDFKKNVTHYLNRLDE
jgi:hypothetical protein